MTDKTFTFTIEEIKDIYRAGIRRGEEIQSAYEWGSNPSGWKYDQLIEAISFILNKNTNWGKADYIDINTIEEWFKGK